MVPISSVPLKAMCSIMCASPVLPSGSCASPASTMVKNEKTGASRPVQKQNGKSIGKSFDLHSFFKRCQVLRQCCLQSAEQHQQRKVGFQPSHHTSAEALQASELPSVQPRNRGCRTHSAHHSVLTPRRAGKAWKFHSPAKSAVRRYVRESRLSSCRRASHGGRGRAPPGLRRACPPPRPAANFRDMDRSPAALLSPFADRRVMHDHHAAFGAQLSHGAFQFQRLVD